MSTQPDLVFTSGRELLAMVPWSYRGALGTSWHAHSTKILKMLGLPSLAALESKSPIARTFLPGTARLIRETMGDATLSVADPDSAISQHDLVSASIVAAANFVQESTAGDLLMAASIRCGGGPGAGAWLRAPFKPCSRMMNMQFVICLRTRLHPDIPLMQSTCKHRRPDGTCCGAPLDAEKIRARSCAVGGWPAAAFTGCLGRRKRAGQQALHGGRVSCGREGVRAQHRRDGVRAVPSLLRRGRAGWF